jgi:hypothetical protein
MFDPMQATFAATHQPVENFNNLDEELHAQRHGQLVRLPSLWSKFTLRLGKLLIRIGEKMTGECSSIDFSRETV